MNKEHVMKIGGLCTKYKGDKNPKISIEMKKLYYVSNILTIKYKIRI